MRPLPLVSPIALALAALLVGACRTAESVLVSVASPDADQIHRDIAYLADDRLEGRGTGTAGNDSAAAYLARRLSALGLRPLLVDTARGDCRGAEVPTSCRVFLQRFTAYSAEMAHAGRAGGVPTQNVIALIPGRDPALRSQFVVIGAHYDHLGRSTAGAMDPEARDAIRNGADDNASGTAAVLELARMFSERPARRSILVAHFSGEELGLLGSQWLVEHAPAPVTLDSVTAMVNFDMVGRLRNDKLIVYGVATAHELRAIVDSANVAPRLSISAQGDGFGPSDHSSFYAKGIPVLHFFTDLHDDYHRATDDVEKINTTGEARVVALAERVVRAIADRPARLTAVRVAAPTPAIGGRESSGAYLGSIPDMSAADVPGLRLSGVRAGSPADLGGLRAGDVIVAFGGRKVKDLYSYTDALYANKPGDRVEVVFLRNGSRQTTSVTLGRRGQ
ncbi:MAG: M28 family peptidase [Gemmatimonadota bacterium]|nr:M28 family peptidase [Gemmatimonadota bacterium]